MTISGAEAHAWLEAHAPGLPMALLCDFDGTLVEFAERPDQVMIPAELVPLVCRLYKLLGRAMGVVSGRRLAELEHWLQPFRGVFAALHGAEMHYSPEDIVRHHGAMAVPEVVRERILRVAEDCNGLYIEDKGPCIAVHYTLPLPEAEALEARLNGCLAGFVEWHLLHGRLVMEVRHRGANKGIAVAEILSRAPFAGRFPVCLGDDTTDIDMFSAVKGAGGIAIAVGTRVGVHSDFALATPAAARAWLTRLATIKSAASLQ